MHILLAQGQTLDILDQPVDLGQSPGDLVVLSFTDSDLSGFAAAGDPAFAEMREARPSLRLASLAQLRHPMSIDLYVERVIERARFVLIRLLGGLDYWRYGVEQIFAAAKRQNIPLAIVAGDATADPRLATYSTVPPEALERLWQYCREGGVANLTEALRCGAGMAGFPTQGALARALPHFGAYRPDHGVVDFVTRCSGSDMTRPAAAIIFYRSLLLSGDLAPIDALHHALIERGMTPISLFAGSLKDPAAAQYMRQSLAALRPAVIVNTTAFSARTTPDDPSPLDTAGVPVLQAVLAGTSRALWETTQRGLSAADLAMNVVLPELDGRLLAGAVSFKRAAEHSSAFQFTRLAHEPDANGISHVAELAAAWAKLAACAPAARRLALILPDYPGKSGRAGSSVGLDGPESAAHILQILSKAGYGVDGTPDATEIFRRLAIVAQTPFLDGATYRRLLADFPPELAAKICDAWGKPEDDPDFCDGHFRHRLIDLSGVVLAIQPDRASTVNRKASYHDPSGPPRHAYLAFHLWLRHIRRVHAIIMLGAHGTLEWLPGKAVALSENCYPRAITGPTPILYPFIVSNPGEAAQAKRRLGAVAIGHMTPPIMTAGMHGAAGEIEPLIEEFSEAQGLDPRRASRLADEILTRAQASGLARECGIDTATDRNAAVAKLDAWLCELKEMRIRDGQHVFGRTAQAQGDDISLELRQACAKAERDALTDGLMGAFIAPGPGGAPSRGRQDVMPTGRNLYTVDPRAVPTRTAMALGHRAATEFIKVHLQDHGDWPRHVVMDLWASATMRTGGEDLAQALSLIGVRPSWDHASTRVFGFEILPLAKMEWPRIDVTLRISGLFRDVFPAQLALFDAAISQVAALDEPEDSNFLIAASARRDLNAPRIFGPAPGAYGSGIERLLAEGRWTTRDDLTNAYLDASSYAYGQRWAGENSTTALRHRLASADAILHIGDVAESDALESDTVTGHIGGLAAAIATASSNAPALYESHTGDPERPRVQLYQKAVARAARGRAANPRWLAGQMRHGASGAAVIADTVDALFAYAATTGADCETQFALLFDAYLGNQDVRGFLETANPKAFEAIRSRFDEAIRRGLWKSRRNSVMHQLAEGPL